MAQSSCLSRELGLAISVIVVLLLHLDTQRVVAEGDLSDVCPSFPTSGRDPAGKDGSGQALHSQWQQQQIKRKLRILSGTSKQGVRPLFGKSPNQEKAGTNLWLPGAELLVLKAEASDLDVFSVTVNLTLRFWPELRSMIRRRRGEARVHEYSVTEIVIVADGLFSAATGDLCVVGSLADCIDSNCKYKLSMKYPTPTTIRHRSIVGKLFRISEATHPNRSDPVIITAPSSSTAYQYTLNDTLTASCPAVTDVTARKLWTQENFLLLGLDTWSYRVTWHPGCKSTNCSPFAGLNRTSSDVQNSLRFERVHGSGNRMNGVAVFQAYYAGPFNSYPAEWGTFSNEMFNVEGVWNSTTGNLCMLACHPSGDEDCQIALTMQFPLTLSVSERAVAVGQVRSLRKVNDTAYFKPFTFTFEEGGHSTGSYGSRLTDLSRQQPEYVYSKVEKAYNLCYPGVRNTSFGKYPSGMNWRDLQFLSLRKDSQQDPSEGSPYVSLNLFTIGSHFPTFRYRRHAEAIDIEGDKEPGMMNVSYSINYQIKNSSAWDASISAEGVYDPETGRLCLIGCQFVDLQTNGLTELEGESQKDCQLFFSIQLPPDNSGIERLRGSLKSLRNATDPLYFKPGNFSGFVLEQEKLSILRVDLEIVLCVVMLSLTVIFILVQLVYSKRYPDTLPYISTSMLLLLSLAHMIPLVLNFEALFQNSSSYYGYRALQMPGGWLEADEVVVRLSTMTAMLLQLRLLHLVWKSRNEARISGILGSGVQERRVLYVILPMYVVGGVIGILAHFLFGIQPLEREYYSWLRNKSGFRWDDVKAYGGLLLDFHLLPQVVGNIVWVAKEQSPLAKPFYLGMALVRSLPHIYDMCRKKRFIPSYSSTYLYASPEWDFYSGTSDVLIPCAIVFLAILLYMQQRWGGRCILPQRCPGRFQYKKVPSSAIS